MYKYIGKQKECKNHAAANNVSSEPNNGRAVYQFIDKRSDASAQKTFNTKDNRVAQCFIKIAVASSLTDDKQNQGEMTAKRIKLEAYTTSRMKRAAARNRVKELAEKVEDLKEEEYRGKELGDNWVIANVALSDALSVVEGNEESEKKRKIPTTKLKKTLNELLDRQRSKSLEVKKYEKRVSDLKEMEENGTELGDNWVIANVAHIDAVNSLNILNKEIMELKANLRVAEENDPEYFYDDGKPNETKFTLLDNYAIASKSLDEALKSLNILNLKNPKAEKAIVSFSDVEELFKIWMGVNSDGVVVRTENNDYQKRKDEKIQGEMRYYHTYEELAWALTRTLGLDQEKDKITGDSKEDEQGIARSVLSNATIKQLLLSVGAKVSRCICSSIDLTGMSGDYYKLHGKKFTEIIELFSTQQASVNAKDSIAMLHDLSSGIFLNKALTWIKDLKKIENPSITIKSRGSGSVSTNKIDMRYNVGTVDEASDWTLFMRSLGHNNLWAGPSYTAYQMINMAKESGGTQDELDAIAYAIFAYWCVEYPHTATPIHTFHEVMTTAQALGVKYDPFSSVTENAKKYSNFTT